MSTLSLDEIAQALGGDVSGKEVRCPGVGHSPKDRSLCVKINDAGDDVIVHCFAPGDDPLASKDHVRSRLGLAPWRANGTKAKGAKAGGEGDVFYIYETETGAPYLRVKRTPDKQFIQYHLEDGAWVKGHPKGPKVPFHLPQLIAAEHGLVIVVEGEKDVLTLEHHGFVATTAPMGAGKWWPELDQWFKDRDVVVMGDNDPPGELHVTMVESRLKPVAQSVRIVHVPAKFKDVSDWVSIGGATADDIGKLVDAKPEEETEETPHGGMVRSSGEFIKSFTPPDYLIDGLLQRRFCYSMTGMTGSGKTAILLLLSACVSLGRPIGDYQVEKGRVLYLAGENPDDVRMRWIAMSQAMNFDLATIDAYFISGVHKLSEVGPRIKAEVEKIGPVSLVIVDTGPAYYEGDDDNANVQQGQHARRMRALVGLAGGPTVLVACHPIKHATPDNLQPRGGGAFLAEVDGNLTVAKSDDVSTLSWQGKFRGPDFAPVSFLLKSMTTSKLQDSKGRLIPSIVAKVLTERERGDVEAASASDENMMLVAMAKHEGASFAGLADLCRWINGKGAPDKSKVQRVADRLKRDGLAKMVRKALTLTERGKAEAAKAVRSGQYDQNAFDAGNEESRE